MSFKKVVTLLVDSWKVSGEGRGSEDREGARSVFAVRGVV